MNTLLKIGLSVAILLGIGIVLSASKAGESEAQIVTVTSDFNSRYHITMPPVPDTIWLCGELVPQSNWEVKERLERELLSNTYWQSNTVLLLKRSGKYFPLMDRILAEEGVPLDFKYLAVAESGLKNVVSPSNAAGYWQFLSGTAKEFGLEVNGEVDERDG